MKRSRLASSLCAAAVAAFATTAGAAPCAIDGNTALQPIDGFGFSTAWSGRLSSSLADTMFGTGPNQLGFTILRIRIDPNRAWADETANAAAARARGVKVFGTPWTPPASMKTNNNVVHGSLRTDQYANYAAYLNQAISAIGLDIISLQNEPDWDPDYEGCVWTGAQFHDFIAAHGSTLTKPIMMPESLQFRDEMSDPTLNDPNTASKVSIVAGHFYGGGNRVHQNALNKGKRVWQTEHYIDGTDNITSCVNVAKTVSDAINNRFSAYLWWWLNATDTNAGLVTTGGQPHKNAYTLAQFAKFVRPGMTRVGATYSPTTNVYVTAYKNANTLSIVAINAGTSAVSQQFTLANLSASSLGVVRTSASENLATVAAASVANGSFTYNLPAQSITTFSGPIGGSTTTYALTVTKGGTGSGTVAGGAIDCGATCSANVASGTAVTLAATPASGSTFGGWSGACTGTGSCVVTMTAARAVTATFNATPVTTPAFINVGGAASGTWAADTGFTGGSTYSVTTAIDTAQLAGTIPPQAVLQTERYGEFTYTLGGFTAGSTQAVTLYFAEVYWTAAGQRTFNVAINGTTVLTAFDIYAAAGGTAKAVSRTFDATASASGQVVIQFTRAGGPDNPKVSAIGVGTQGPGTQYALTVTRAGTGGGTVTGASINCGTTCSASYDSGTTVTLTAAAASGSTFGGWSGACTGTAATCTVSMTAARAVTATFDTVPTDGCKTASGGQSGNFNTTGAVCYTVNATINGWGCSNAEGRTVTVNGTAVTCGQRPLPGSAPYTFRFTAGSYPWASFYWW